MDLHQEAVRLRVEEHLSYREITERLGVPKGTLSGWLREHRLPDKVLREKMGGRGYRTPKKSRGKEAPLHQMQPSHKMSRHQKAKIAEAATMLRLVAFGFSPFGSVFDGDKTDWLVEAPTGKVWKVQVKWVGRKSKHGLPIVRLSCRDGHKGVRAYREGEFDILVGYDYFTDTAYVWTWDEVKHLKTTVTICPEAAEQWDKMGL